MHILYDIAYFVLWWYMIHDTILIFILRVEFWNLSDNGFLRAICYKKKNNRAERIWDDHNQKLNRKQRWKCAQSRKSCAQNNPLSTRVTLFWALFVLPKLDHGIG